jgi:hypothetical protein
MVKAEACECALSAVPRGKGTASPFYRPGEQFTIVSHSFSYVWRYGLQHRGVDGRPGESCSWPSVRARPVSVQERLRGWPCGDFPFGVRTPTRGCG